MSTKEGRPVDDDSYLGYSVTTGDFEGDGVIGSAVGMPRGENLLGKVIYSRLKYISNFSSVLSGVNHAAQYTALRDRYYYSRLHVCTSVHYL